MLHDGLLLTHTLTEDRSRSVEWLLAGSFPCLFAATLATRGFICIFVVITRNTGQPPSQPTARESFGSPRCYCKARSPRIANRLHRLNIDRLISAHHQYNTIFCPPSRLPVPVPLQTPHVSREVSLYEQLPYTLRIRKLCW
jgi:hypothetical protein